jgi:hypothetical protein
MKTGKVKTYLCIEHGEKFLIDAFDRAEADEVAAMYGGSVIKEVSKEDLKKKLI